MLLTLLFLVGVIRSSNVAVPMVDASAVPSFQVRWASHGLETRQSVQERSSGRQICGEEEGWIAEFTRPESFVEADIHH